MDGASFCKQCGNPLESVDQFCSKCGAKNESNLSHDQAPKETIQFSKHISPKSATTALLLNFFLGVLGAHRLYVGKIGTGLLMLVTIGGFGIWVLVDLILIVTNKFEDKQGGLLELTQNSSPFKTAIVISTVLAWLLLYVLMVFALVFYFTSGLVYTIEHQLNALQSGNIEKAYSYTSKDFQKTTSINDFKKFLDQYPSIKNNESYFFNTREIENNLGFVKGTLTAKDGAKTPIEYRLIKEDDTWKILNIKVVPTGASIMINNKTSEPPSTTPSQENSLPKLFEAKGNKYSIRYPDDWSYVSPSKGTIVFMGKKGTAAYHVNVNIQTILSKKSGGKYSSIKEIVDDLKKQLSTQASNAKILSQGEGELPKNPKRFHGEYLVFTYTFKGKTFKQLEFIISRDDELAFYTWAYTAPSDQYDINLPIAKAMYESWIID
ncbi:DUF4864 domain-containing protein [Legionella sp. WA2024007413]